MKKVKYDNKSILNVHKVSDCDLDSLHGKQIIGIMSNKFIDVSYIFKYESNEETIYFNLLFSKEKFDALNYIYTSAKNNIQMDVIHPIHSKVPEFVKSIENGNIDAFFEDRFASKTILYYEYILPVEELSLTFDIDDVKQDNNNLNMLTYDKFCDYYTSSFALHLNENGHFENIKFFQYDTNELCWSIVDNKFSIIENDKIKFINFFYNIDLMYGDKKVN